MATKEKNYSLLFELYKKAKALMDKHFGWREFPDFLSDVRFLARVMDEGTWNDDTCWKKQEEAIAAALYAHGLCMVKGKEEEEHSETCKEQARAFEFKAMELVTKHQEEHGMKTTKDLLLKTEESWHENTCIELAVSMRCRRVLAMPTVQRAVDDEWNGDIVCQANSVLFWVKLHLALLIPPMLFSLTFKTDKAQDETAESMAEASPDRNERCLRLLRKTESFYAAPIIVFRLRAIFHLIYLGLFSYMILVELDNNGGPLEYTVTIWYFITIVGDIFGVLADIVHLEDRLMRWLSRIRDNWTPWSYVETIIGITITLGFFLRILCNAPCIEGVRILYACSVILQYVRLIQILTVNRNLGLKILMITRMFKDLMGFCVILFTFVYGYAVVAEALLFPNSRLTWQLVLNLPYRAYFHIFGENFLETLTASGNCTSNATLSAEFDIPRCPSSLGSLLVPGLQGVYLLVVNILLLNLLIAMFSDTYTRIQSAEAEYWSLERARLVLEYKHGFALPAPLSIFVILWRVVWYIRLEIAIQDSQSTSRVSPDRKSRSHEEENATMSTDEGRSKNPAIPQGRDPRSRMLQMRQEVEAMKSNLDQLIKNLDDLVAASGKPHKEI